MLALFHRKRVIPTVATAPTAAANSKELMRPESAATLLASPRRKKLLEHIWQRTSLSRKQFAALYLVPLERYAELVQHFPASESHHHAYPGGMLDHGLETVAYALKLRQSHLLPSGATPEDQAAQAEAWTAATAYAALLHDIGKVAVDLLVEQADGSTWHPWHGPLQQRYRFRYRPEREYRLHSAASGLLYNHLLDNSALDWLSDYPALWSALLYVLAGRYEHAGVLGELVTHADRASVSQALGGDPTKALAVPKHALQRKLLAGLRYLLKEEFKLNQPGPSDGWLTDDALWLVSKTVADKLRAHLLSQGIEGIPSSNTAVFDVLQDHGIVQATPDGKAIWRATVSSSSGWSNPFTFLKMSPSLIWEPANRPAPFEGSVETEPMVENAPQTTLVNETPEVDSAITTVPQPSTETIDNLLNLLGTPEPDTIAPTEEAIVPEDSVHHQDAPPLDAISSEKGAFDMTIAPSGQHFVEWLQQAIQSHTLIINDAKALVHTVNDTVYLVSPGIFQRYVQEHPQITTFAKQDHLAAWQWVQKRFEKLQLHRKQDNGLNIWTCEVTGPRKSRRLHGYLLKDSSSLFVDSPLNNPYLTLINE
ncbi:MobH family relaxase [Sodalis ligni]|uniref:Integrating conjugative element relaxase (TIGR03760 family) n=1 Tax=Sodalis ligni TaxID=2697027 RepID=A0A4R1N513_9GAMM|nr:MobH family relaxase [Sodalis ligni]TCL02173.1 integrating conjugative element relaxase (TIGR03760 family) [Sodalis ligni]